MKYYKVIDIHIFVCIYKTLNTEIRYQIQIALYWILKKNYFKIKASVLPTYSMYVIVIPKYSCKRLTFTTN